MTEIKIPDIEFLLIDANIYKMRLPSRFLRLQLPYIYIQQRI